MVRAFKEGSEIRVAAIAPNSPSELSRTSYLEIRIYGLLANLPSLKNGKLPGKNILQPKTRAKLIALTELWEEGPAWKKDWAKFGKEEVFVLLVLAQGSRVDRDGAESTIRDWLEPRDKQVGQKKKKDRGWGIGVVDDDKRITAQTLRASQLGLQQVYTRIIVQPLSQVDRPIGTFIAAITKDPPYGSM